LQPANRIDRSHPITKGDRQLGGRDPQVRQLQNLIDGLISSTAHDTLPPFNSLLISHMAMYFTDTQIKAIAAALGDTADGLTGSEIDFLIPASRMVDYGGPAQNKRTRLYNAFAHSQNTT
jgi:hypothetical protein